MIKETGRKRIYNHSYDGRADVVHWDVLHIAREQCIFQLLFIYFLLDPFCAVVFAPGFRVYGVFYNPSARHKKALLSQCF